MFSTIGMMLMASGADLLNIFIGLEVMSISIYILTGFKRSKLISNEASLKYFLLGAFATGFLLYGISLIYGTTGTIDLRQIACFIAGKGGVKDPLLLMGMGLIIVGLGFKVASVPFHAWVPDVYEGAPTAVTAFMSVGPGRRGICRIYAYLLNGLRLVPLRMAKGHLDTCRVNHDRRKRCGHLPDKHQTDACILQHCPCGLPPRCPRSRE